MPSPSMVTAKEFFTGGLIPEDEPSEIIELPVTCPADSPQGLLKAVADIHPLPSELIVLFWLKSFLPIQLAPLLMSIQLGSMPQI